MLQPLNTHHYYWTFAWENTPLCSYFAPGRGKKILLESRHLTTVEEFELSIQEKLRALVTCSYRYRQKSLSTDERAIFLEKDTNNRLPILTVRLESFYVLKCTASLQMFFSAEKLYFTTGCHTLLQGGFVCFFVL